MSKTRIRQLEAEVSALRRIIKEMTARGRPAPVPDARQTALSLSPFPMTEFAMGPGRDMPLPETLEDIAEVIGREHALRLAEGLPTTGNRPWRKMVYVPQNMKPDHPIVRLLGAEKAAALQRSHTNMILEVPVCADILRAYRAHVIRALSGEGMPDREVAAQAGVDIATVRDVLANAPEAAA